MEWAKFAKLPLAFTSKLRLRLKECDLFVNLWVKSNWAIDGIPMDDLNKID
jgi:hypothetical protein